MLPLGYQDCDLECEKYDKANISIESTRHMHDGQRPAHLDDAENGKECTCG